MSPLSIIVSISFFVVVFFSMLLEMRSQKSVTTNSDVNENNEKKQASVQNEVKNLSQMEKKQRLPWVLLAVVVSVFAVFAGYYFIPEIRAKRFHPPSPVSTDYGKEQETEPKKDSLNSAQAKTSLDTVVVKKNDPDQEVSQQTEASKSPAEREFSGKYAVIVASFGKRSDAEVHGSKLSCDFEIIPVSTNIYRVSVFGSDNQKDAESFKDKWNKDHNYDCKGKDSIICAYCRRR